MISPREYFASLERRDHGAELEGATRLRRACAAARHAEVTAARSDDSGSALDDLVQEYVLFLYSKEGRAQRFLLDEWKGVTISFARFLKRARRRDKSLERQRGLYQELLFDKLRSVLRKESRFASVPPPRPARFRLAAPPSVLEDLACEDLAERLPKLQARLDPVGKKSPEVAEGRALADQLERIFVLTNNEPRTVYALHAPIWETLDPRPDDPRPYAPPLLQDERVPDPVDELVGNSRVEARSRLYRDTEDCAAELEFFEERVDELAYGFLRSLGPRAAQVALHRWATAGGRPRPFAEISKMIGVPPSTVARHADGFVPALAGWSERHHLDETEVALLLNVVWEILAAGDFRPWEGVNS